MKQFKIQACIRSSIDIGPKFVIVKKVIVYEGCRGYSVTGKPIDNNSSGWSPSSQLISSE